MDKRRTREGEKRRERETVVGYYEETVSIFLCIIPGRGPRKGGQVRNCEHVRSPQYIHMDIVRCRKDNNFDNPV